MNTFKTAYPLHRFVTHEFPVHQVDKAMARALDIDACKIGAMNGRSAHQSGLWLKAWVAPVAAFKDWD